MGKWERAFLLMGGVFGAVYCTPPPEDLIQVPPPGEPFDPFVFIALLIIGGFVLVSFDREGR